MQNLRQNFASMALAYMADHCSRWEMQDRVVWSDGCECCGPQSETLENEFTLVSWGSRNAWSEPTSWYDYR